MLKLSKLLLLACLLLSSCTIKKEEPKKEVVKFADPIGSVVSSPVAIPYVWNNPIKIDYINDFNSESIYTYRFVIDGLKDEAVESKINAAILKKFNEMMTYQDIDKLPPYRGIRQKIKTNAQVENMSVYISESYNANYVLSLVINAYISFKNPDDSIVYVNVMDGMTFELIHGEQLNLSDVFTNDADLGKLINNSLHMSLMDLNSADEPIFGGFDMYYGQLTQVGPFKGIKATQPFFISDQGLHLLFDYRTPEFDTGLSTSSISVPYYDFNDHVGITARFTSSTEIFSQPIIDRQFLMLGDPERIQDIEFLTIKNMDYRIMMSYPKDMNPILVTKLSSMRDDIVADLLANTELYGIDYLNASVNAAEFGSYYCLSSYSEFSSKEHFVFRDDFKCYDKNYKEVTLKDYFKPGFDYESAIKALIQKEIDVGNMPSDVSVDELYDHLRIRVETTGFWINSKAYSASEGNQYLGFSPKFSDFGIENLAIFD
jgi:hypothetical protein